MKARTALFFAAAILMTGAAGAAAPSADSCTPRDGMVPVCGFSQPEDLEVLPGGQALIASEMNFAMDDAGGMTYGPGQLSLVDLATDTRRTLYPAEASMEPEDNSWGDPSCHSIGPALSPHGIHLSRRTDGKQQLLVVNHGLRSSVEFFEVLGESRDWRLEWRGCVAFPDAVELNDVAALPGSGFVVTAIVFGDDSYVAAAKKTAQGLNTGFVLRWRPETGYDPVSGSMAPLPNGIQVTPDGSAAFIATHTTEGEVWKFGLADGAPLGKVTVPGVDNLSWGDDGRLLAGTGPHLAPGEPCDRKHLLDTCGSIVRVTAIDPATMQAETVLERPGAPIGVVSVVVQTGGTYIFGTPLGGNLLKVPATR